MLLCMIPAVLATASCTRSASPAPSTQDSVVTVAPVKTYSYLALGDSYTIGQSIDSSGRYPAQAAAMLSAEGISVPSVQYIATTGWTTADLQYAISMQHPADTFDIVTLLIGVNDQYQGVDTGTYALHFNQLLQTSVQLARSNKQHVIVISIPDYGVTPFGGNNASISAQINEFNAINLRITDSFGIAYVNVTTLSRAAGADNSLLAGDGLHYSPKEYALWDTLLVPAIYRALK